MRAWPMVPMLLVAVGAATSAAPSDDPPPGILYLSQDPLTTAGDSTCLTGSPRYVLRLDHNFTAGAVDAPTESNPQYSCPIRWVFSADHDLVVRGDVDLVLHLNCPAGVAPVTPVEVALRAGPGQAQFEPLGTTSRPALNPVTCTGQPIRFEHRFTDVELPVAADDGLDLIVWFRFAAPPGAVQVLLGGDDPSRIVGHGLPRPGASAEWEVADTLYPFTATSAGTGQTPAQCGFPPAYAMLGPGEAGEAGTIAAATSTIASNCRVEFRYKAPSAFTLEGVIGARIWFRCTTPEPASPADFLFQFWHEHEDDAPFLLREPARLVAPPARSGFYGSLEMCGPLIRSAAAVSSIPAATRITAGDILSVHVFAYAVNGPEPLAGLELLVGPDHPSGFFTRNATAVAISDPPAPREEGRRAAPFPIWALTGLLAAVVMRRHDA